jgi:choline dehydrogenase-like flavoprotein
MSALTQTSNGKTDDLVALRVGLPAVAASFLADNERQTALALSRAIMPKWAGLPEAGVETVLRAERWLGDVPVAGAGYRGILRAFDLYARATVGKHLVDLGADQILKLCQRFADGDIGRRYFLYTLTAPLKGAYFDDPAIYQQFEMPYRGAPVGERPASKVPMELPRWAHERTEQAWDLANGEVIECDAVVIGSGAGGAVAAYELANAGRAVVLLEEGQYFGRADFASGAFHLQKLLYRELGVTMAVGNTLIPIPVGRSVGGSTTVNSGTCYRMPGRVFAEWHHHHGLTELSVESMDPFYSTVEEVLRVTPVSKSLLLGNQPIADGCDKLGITRHGPLARNAPDCDGQGLCCFGCPTDAKRSTNVSYVPMALKAGAQLIVGAHAERVLIEGGRAVGVEVTATRPAAAGQKPPRFVIRAKAVVVAGGSLLTPVLLLSDPATRRALGRSGALGNHLTIHPAIGLRAVMPHKLRSFAGVPQGYAVEEFHDEGMLMESAFLPPELTGAAITLVGQPFMEIMAAYDRQSCFGFLVEDKGNGSVRPGPGGRPLIHYNLADRDVARLTRGASLVARMFLAAGAERVLTGVAALPMLTRHDEIDRLSGMRLKARDFELTAYHPLGTARMGHDPRTSVVDTDLQAHDLPGLHICDGSVIPTSPAVNPQMTIMALAMRAARRLAERL